MTDALEQILAAEETGHQPRKALRVETKDITISKQKAMVPRAENYKTRQMLRDKVAKPLQTQRKQTSIELARENRTGERRSKTELLEGTFNLMNDGKSRSVSKIARDLDASWGTIYWLMRQIEYVQSMPVMIREPGMKRKRIYRIAGPRRR